MIRKKVLMIGNSFSQDTSRYVHEIAKSDGNDMKIVNLYIGGCSLRQHFININNDSALYEMEFNGARTGFYVSVKQALQSDDWDIVTVQQVSGLSVDYDTYQPYLNYLVEFINFHCPKAEIMINQTWAYEDNSDRLVKELDYKSGNSSEMLYDIKNSYNCASKDIGGAVIIPCGEVMYSLSQSGIGKVHRDTYHADLGFGRYALGLTLYEMITGANSENNIFSDLDVKTDDKKLNAVRKTVHSVVKMYR